MSWSDFGGTNGTIVVTANTDQDFFINRDLGVITGAKFRRSGAVEAGIVSLAG